MDNQLVFEPNPCLLKPSDFERNQFSFEVESCSSQGSNQNQFLYKSNVSNVMIPWIDSAHNCGVIGKQKAYSSSGRKQLTLDTLSLQSPRSRSPIVCVRDRKDQKREINSKDIPINRMPVDDSALRADCSSRPMHLMSPEIFKRRRKVYEPHVGGDRATPNDANASVHDVARTDVDDSAASTNYNISLIEQESNLDELELSSDMLVKIIDGKLQLNNSESTASESDHIKDNTLVNGTEMQEFRSTNVAERSATGANFHAAEELLPKMNERLNLNPIITNSSSSNLSSLNGCPVNDNNNRCHESAVRRRSRDDRARKNERATGFEIAWLDFTYSVEPNVLEDPRWGRINKLFHKEHRMILKGLSGGLKSGQMVALMGPSGAGKTCLLESISGVRTTGIGGRVCLRGRKKAQLVIVPQYDDFMPQFTVEETIIYGSRMKNGMGANHRKVADTVIKQLGLQACRSNNIQSCSGGQRKRVAIAQELVSRPNILILDEPTSGLDSSCCYHTMKVLRDVIDQSVHTEEPMAIVSTIHQPSAKVFKMFDSVYLLGKTGYMAYSGPPDELVSTVRDVTGLECPKYSNPSDFMIELVAYDYGEEPVEKLIEFERQKAAQFKRDFERRAGVKSGRRAPLVKAAAAAPIGSAVSGEPQGAQQQERPSSARSSGYRSSSVVSLGSGATRMTPSKSDTHLAASSKADPIQHRLKINEVLLSGGHIDYQNNVTLPLKKATSEASRRHPFFWHTWVHLHRSFLQAVRDPILNNMRILIHLGFATLLVLLYGEKSGKARGCPPVLGLPREITDPNNESMIDLADNVGYLFMCIMMITYVSLMSTVLTFPIDIKTVGKEYKNGWYGTVTYFLGKTIADMPFIVVYPVVYCFITWYMTNQAQDHFWRYLSFNGLIIMNAMNSQSFGLILGALFVNSVTAATFLGPVMTIPWYLFTGFTKRAHRLAEPFKTASKFLFTRHVFEGILDTVYGHQRCNCSEFLEQYYQLRFKEARRLGQLISAETLSSLDYYDGLETVADVVNETLFPRGKDANWFERTVDAASTVFGDGDDLNLASLMDTNVKASSLFSFGLDFEPTCPKDYESFVVQDFRIGERNVQDGFVFVFCMLCVIRTLTFVLVAWKIRTRQL